MGTRGEGRAGILLTASRGGYCSSCIVRPHDKPCSPFIYPKVLPATPLDRIAADQGFTNLGTARQLLGRYQGRTGFAQKAWIKNNQTAVIGFMRGYRDAMDWLYDRNNRAAADLLMANDSSVTAELARLSLDILLDEKGGFWRDLALDLEGIRTVLPLRTRFGVPQKTMTDPVPYVDLTLHQKAFGSR